MKKKFYKWIKEILLYLIVLALSLNIISYLRSPKQNSIYLPNLTLTTTYGKPIELNAQKKEPVVLHFWATWCPTCKLEASTIEKISHKYKVITIVVNSGDNQNINTFLKKHDYTFDVVNDQNSQISSNFNISGFPTTLFYDKNKKLKFSEVGYTSTFGFLVRLWLCSL